MLKKVLEYVITFVVCSIITFIIIACKGTFSAPDTKTTLHYLVDSFFVVGVICAAFGLFVMASNGGAYDFIVYGVTRFIAMFTKKGKTKYETYYDYHIAKAERQKSSFFYLIAVGSLFIIVSLILLAFWAQYE